VEFRAFAPIRWETVEVQGLEEASTLDGVVRRVRTVWDGVRDADAGGVAEWMVRVRLSGATPLWKELSDDQERRVVADELAGALGALDVALEAAVHPVVAMGEHRAREDVLGEALKLVDEVRGGGSLPVSPDELAGFEGRDGEGLDDYVRSLLESAEGEVLSRLLRNVD
jgi:hypothetical protein